jgi:predicted nucleotidyltransferase
MSLHNIHYEHHLATIQNVYAQFIPQDQVLAVFLGGSIAHGYARPDSDVDLLIVLTDEEYNRRKASGELLYYNPDLCTYSGGYVDGKFITEDYIRVVAERGNEPSRYAFKDCQEIFCREQRIQDQIAQASRFPDENRAKNAERFYAQLQAWKWYYSEGSKHKNPYLVGTAIQNIALYACRIILNHNRRLYPYHKWMLAEVEQAPIKPQAVIELINKLVINRRKEDLETLCQAIDTMGTTDQGPYDWPGHFLQDVETPWMRNEPYIADL